MRLISRSLVDIVSALGFQLAFDIDRVISEQSIDLPNNASKPGIKANPKMLSISTENWYPVIIFKVLFKNTNLVLD